MNKTDFYSKLFLRVNSETCHEICLKNNNEILLNNEIETIKTLGSMVQCKDSC